MRKDSMHLLANVEFVVIRCDSPHIPFEVVEVRDITPAPDMQGEDGEDMIREELQFVEHDMIPLPENVRTMSFDDMAIVKAELWGDYYSFETDYGTEYDAEFEFRNENVKIEPYNLTP